MPRPESRYVCGTCGTSSLRWEGQCRSCGGWNTLVETPIESRRAPRTRAAVAPAVTALSAVHGGGEADRPPVGIGELDRVLGGGIVAGSVILLGGEPGIGKSTLVLALCGAIATRAAAGESEGATVLYASGEESAAQLRLRAVRLGLASGGAADRIGIIAETSVERIVAAAEATEPRMLVVDSIQTLTTGELDGPAGSVGQVRAAAARLQAYAKENAVPVVLVGHVTKDGTLAGPKTLEHMVDVVLTLEGERFSGMRLLRATKNRFGSTEEVGVFEMAATGLREVPDPQAAFLEPDSLGAPGVVVAATLEGTRPLLVEVQALVAPQVHGSPRRTAAGLDPQRLSLLIAVLGRRAGINLAAHDVYASVVGGLTVGEPAIDLPVALALASALRDRPLLPGTVCCAEVGLTGDLRPVGGLERRLREAARLGFARAIVPRATGRQSGGGQSGGGQSAVGRSALGRSAGGPAGQDRPPQIEIIPVATLREALASALAPGPDYPAANPSEAVAVIGSPAR